MSTFGGGGGGGCFRTWLPCFCFPFSLQVNHKLFCYNVCLWEDFCSSFSSSAWSSDWSRRSLSRAGRSCCWLAQMPGADTGIVLINAFLLLAWQRGKEINFFPPFLSPQHFTEFLDEFSPDVLGQLLNDPFLSEKNEIMEVELSPASPAPLIQAEHSYSLCGDSRPQSPLTHISTDDNFNEGTMHWALVHLSWWCSNEMFLVAWWCTRAARECSLPIDLTTMKSQKRFV